MLKNYVHTVDYLFVLVLVCLMAMCSLSIVYTGSQIYCATAQTLENNNSFNIAIDYIQEKVRQSLASDQITVTTTKGLDVLCIHETYNQKSYTTYIYVYDQQLREQLIPDDQDFHQESGEALLPVDQLNMTIDHNLLSLTFRIGDQTQTTLIALLGGSS